MVFTLNDSVITVDNFAPYAAGAAAAAGRITRVWVRLSDPADKALVGTAEVFAFAQDPDGGAVAIAGAAAGIPVLRKRTGEEPEYGTDNEVEYECEAVGADAKKGISLYLRVEYDKRNLSVEQYLVHTGAAPNPDPACAGSDPPDSTLEDEAEAEAGYGVAAAAAGAAASGYYADAQTSTATATEKVDFKYEKIYESRHVRSDRFFV